MHIKQVIISGFRSFKIQSEIEPFSPKHNVVVGRNGSGKSNFFNAIQFVLLAPKFQNLSQEERQHLLHEGAGSSVMAAYVEIIFDNSDGRLPVDSDEVILRRTIGHKKDEFFLNRKRIQKNEVISLLESAGFSKSNPYYIVQQGKVANLCVMKDRDRLNLLKEIAGTTVYEERRAESIKIMQDAISKQEKINEVLSYIEDRLSELDKEKEELREYDNLDKAKRAIEFNLYDKELSRISIQLEEIENVRSEKIQQQHELYSTLRLQQDKVLQSEESSNHAKIALERLVQKRIEKVKELKDGISRRSALLVNLQEVKDNSAARNAEKQRITSQLQEVNTDIASKQQMLSTLDPQQSAGKQQLDIYRKEYSELRSQADALYGKQGRGRQFSTKKERNAFLAQQIGVLQTQVQGKEERAARMENEISVDEKACEADKRSILSTEKDVTDKHAQLESIMKRVNELTRSRNDLQERRKESWKALETFQEELVEAQGELEKGKQMLRSAVPPHISMGLATVERIVQEKRLSNKQYFGPLIDNFTLRNDAFRTAVEVAAGNSLFHVIVDTDVTAAMLMKELEARKGGRLTFLPLNRLRNENIAYPDSSDVRPLAEIALQYNANVTPAILQVFGKKLLARDLDIAAKFSKEFQLDAITREGDVVNRKGGFEGGYYDDRSSRILSIMKIRSSTAALDKLMQNENLLKQQSEQLEESVNSTLRELQQAETERDKLRSVCNQINVDLGNRKARNEITHSSILKRRTALAEVMEDIVVSRRQIEEYQTEMATPLQATLTNSEIQDLQRLNERIQVLQENINNLQANLIDLTGSCEHLRADLKNNLMKRHAELENAMAAIEEQEHLMNDDNKEVNIGNELDRATSEVKMLEKEIDVLDANIAVSKQDVIVIDNEVENEKNEERKLSEEMNEISKNQDKLLNKRTMLMETSTEKQRLMRDIGSLPRKELEEYKDYSEKNLMKELKDVNEKLKKYSGVNRKALDQYISFNDQRTQLLERKTSIVKDNNAIEELISSLDMQKEEAIYRTFQGVSKHFSEVFRDLVPGGDGKLLMLTNSDMDGNEEKTSLDHRGSDIGSSTQGNINSFQGVQVIVSFVASGQQFEMQQLSGGQKALVALALIFAIQRCDPAPFYLFDEIDQALDASYRAGVARLIQKQANDSESPAQFITTTFRPELVKVADKCYGIALSNKMSNIHSLTKEEAEIFVTNLMTEEEATRPGAIRDISTMSTAAIPNGNKKQKVPDLDDENDGGDENIEKLVPSKKSSSSRRK